MMKRMRRLVRGLSLAVMVVAIANPLAAVCLCQQAVSPITHEHSCCHKPAPAGETFRSVPSCCHADQADHGAARLDSPQVAPAPSQSDVRPAEIGSPSVSALLAHAFVPPHRLTVLRV